jgi:SAM-dependent methyltransferase
MPPATFRSTNYDGFAWFYDRYFGSRYHGPVLQILERILLPKIPAEAHILDLCCGTGHLTGPLAGRGYHLVGIDNSPRMLGFARQNVPGAHFIQADARAFRLGPAFHAAISTFDSLNHVLTIEDLSRVFRNVADALLPSGLFLFDLNVEEAYRTLWDKSEAFVEEDCAYFIRGGYDPARRLGRTEITTFRRLQQWERGDVKFYQRCHAPHEVAGALTGAGFRDVACHDSRDLGMSGELSIGRVFFEARKPGATV